MSLPSGTAASDELASELPYLKSDASVRTIKVEIRKGTFVLTGVCRVKNSWLNDYCATAKKLLEDSFPCYLFIRLDEPFEKNFVMITWVPSKANVRLRMLYATAKSELKTIFGTSRIAKDIQATCWSECDAKTLDDKTSLTGSNSTAPVDYYKYQADKVPICELACPSPSEQKASGPINLELSDQLKEYLRDFANKKINHICMAVDFQTEGIFAERVSPYPVIASAFHPRPGRYHLFRERSTPQTILAYVTPSFSNVPVKERMVYASAWSRLSAALSEHSVPVDKKFEVSDGADLVDKLIKPINEPASEDTMTNAVAVNRPQPPGRPRPPQTRRIRG